MAQKRIIYKLTDERIPAVSGIGLAGDILHNAGFQECFQDVRLSETRSRKQISIGTILITFLALLCMGKPDFECVRELQNDAAFYQYALHLKKGFPSSATLRQRMDEIGCKVREMLLEFNAHLFKSNRIAPSALKMGMIPLDIDVTPMDNSKTKKQGVSWTYKKFEGYAPIMAYLGTEGYLVNAQLREGSQHCQKDTPAFLRQTLHLCKEITNKPVLVRLDSGNDAAENVGILLENGAYYIIKRNLRRESQMEWADKIRSWCVNKTEVRQGKTLYIGSTFKDISYVTEDNEHKTIRNRIVYEMVERTEMADGQILLEPDIELKMYWTNLGDSDQTIIDLYHNHAVCEQFHSEIKTDMGVERLPSGKFDTNELVLELTMIAYNVLRLIGQETVRQGKAPAKRSVKRKRLRTVIQNLIHCAGRIVTHARRTCLCLSKSNAWAECFLGLSARLCQA